MEFSFENIPEKGKLLIYEKHKFIGAVVHDIKIGTGILEFKIPIEWNSPQCKIIFKNYSTVDINLEKFEESKIEITGDQLYIKYPHELLENHINGSQIIQSLNEINLNSRISYQTKFHLTLLSLQGLVDTLTYGISVLSGFKSKCQFDYLLTATEKISTGFSLENKNLYKDHVLINPIKKIYLDKITTCDRIEVQRIFTMIQELSKEVLQFWSYDSSSKKKINKYFKSIDLEINLDLEIPEFYRDVILKLLSLYDKIECLEKHVLLFKEKEITSTERSNRGYR